MNKDEILAKAQKQNIHGDERELQIEVESRQKSALFAESCCFLMYIISVFADEVRWEYLHAVFFMNAAYHTYRALKLRKKSDIFMALFLGICSIALAWQYVQKILGQWTVTL